MEKPNVVGSVSKPSPEELLAMYEKFDTQSKEIRAQFKRGVLSPWHVQALIEHRNPFPPLQPWRILKLGTPALRGADDFRKALKNSGNKISDYANDILSRFTVSTEEIEVDLYNLTTAELTGKKEGGTTAEVFAGAEHLGLEKCTPEVGPQLRLQYPDQPLEEWLLIGMDPITDSDGHLEVFRVVRLGDGRWLHGCYANPDFFWSGSNRWAFLRRRRTSA